MVFKMDKNSQSYWSSNVLNVLTSVGLENLFFNNGHCNLEALSQQLMNNVKEKWHIDVKCKPKLRTYVNFKKSFGTETYLLMNLERDERSHLAQLRFGILPLRIETGRYCNEK